MTPEHRESKPSENPKKHIPLEDHYVIVAFKPVDKKPKLTMGIVLIEWMEYPHDTLEGWKEATYVYIFITHS
jgi:hypothetical protein